MKDLIYIVGILFTIGIAGALIDIADEFNFIVAFILRLPAMFLMVNGIIRLTENK
jgi:hypothetical protein